MTWIEEKIPNPINIQEVITKYPVMYEESMNTVLIQEVIRCIHTHIIHTSEHIRLICKFTFNLLSFSIFFLIPFFSLQ